MHISRRGFMHFGVMAAAAGCVGGFSSKVGAQTTTLSAPWMGWPEEQVTPLISAFESQTGIKVAAERLPIAELFRTLEIRLAARGALPDVYLVDGPLTASYAARGHLLDLSELLEKDRDRFIPTTLLQGMYDGKLYAMPFATSSQLLFYNKKLLAEAGIEPPSIEPQARLTWDALLTLAQNLTRADRGQFGFAFEFVNPYQLLPLPQSLGVEVIGPDGLTASGYVDSEGMIEVFNWYQGLFQTHKVSPIGTFQSGIVQEMFGQGKLAMMVGGPWNLQGFQKFDNLDFGVAAHPYFAGGKPVTPTGSWNIGINPRTAHREESQIFIKWLALREAMSLWFDLRQYPPVLIEIWDERTATDFADPAWSLVRYELANTAVTRPLTPGYREYEDFFKVAMQDIQTGANVKESLTRAAVNIDREMRKYR